METSLGSRARMRSSEGAGEPQGEGPPLQFPRTFLRRLPGRLRKKEQFARVEQLLEEEFPKWSLNGIAALAEIKGFLQAEGDPGLGKVLGAGPGTGQLTEAQQVALGAAIRDPGGFKFFAQVDEMHERLLELVSSSGPEEDLLLGTLLREAEDVLAEAEEAYSRGTLEVSWVLHHPSFTEGSSFEEHRKAVFAEAVNLEKLGISSGKDVPVLDRRWPKKCAGLCSRLWKLAGGKPALFEWISKEVHGEFVRARHGGSLAE